MQKIIFTIVILFTACINVKADIRIVQNARIDFPDEIVEMYFDKTIGTEDKITVGRILDGRLSYTLPSSLDDKYLIDPSVLGAYDITDGMRISMVHFDPAISLYRFIESSSTHIEHRYYYSNIEGSYKIGEQIIELYKGWNLLRVFFWLDLDDKGNFIFPEEYSLIPQDTYIHDLYTAGFSWYAEYRRTSDDEAWWLE
ncbi:MAG: hypothetical protein FWH19_03890 [Treponema sp.]|nr:hypothetical protein [Treponema sp.]